MSRVKLSEYSAKSLLVPGYTGTSLRLASLKDDITRLAPGTEYIIKVDQGIKKRGQQGLITLRVTKTGARKAVLALSKRGFQRFIAEPMFLHAGHEEKYVCFERIRDGIRILYSPSGGMSIEDSPESVTLYNEETVPLPHKFVTHIIDTMNREHLSYIEINPLIVRGVDCFLLDAAVLADSAAAHLTDWTNDDIVEAHVMSTNEQVISDLNANSPAAFTFRVLNTDGAIWLLLSGGGASITIADEAANEGKADLLGNYGEYSGGPTAEESYLYTKEVLRALLHSKAPHKALIIAGGVANFTDVAKTFRGVIQALDEVASQLQRANIRVFVRRGGPHEREGLQTMSDFLRAQKLYGSVHGSEAVLTDVIHEALEAINA